VYDFAREMKAAGRHFAYCVYEADHGFNDPTAHSWNPEAAQQARERTASFLRKHLTVGSLV
jgi:dienelactone hydrolase